MPYVTNVLYTLSYSKLRPIGSTLVSASVAHVHCWYYSSMNLLALIAVDALQFVWNCSCIFLIWRLPPAQHAYI